jgi:hypothetical protein
MGAMEVVNALLRLVWLLVAPLPADVRPWERTIRSLHIQRATDWLWRTISDRLARLAA